MVVSHIDRFPGPLNPQRDPLPYNGFQDKNLLCKGRIIPPTVPISYTIAFEILSISRSTFSLYHPASVPRLLHHLAFGPHHFLYYTPFEVSTARPDLVYGGETGAFQPIPWRTLAMHTIIVALVVSLAACVLGLVFWDFIHTWPGVR